MSIKLKTIFLKDLIKSVLINKNHLILSRKKGHIIGIFKTRYYFRILANIKKTFKSLDFDYAFYFCFKYSN